MATFSDVYIFIYIFLFLFNSIITHAHQQVIFNYEVLLLTKEEEEDSVAFIIHWWQTTWRLVLTGNSYLIRSHNYLTLERIVSLRVSKQHNFFSFLRKNMHSCMFYFWGKTGVPVHGVLTSNAFSLNLIICIKLVYVPLFYKYCHDCNFDLSAFCI